MKMSFSASEITGIIAQGESSAIEFKSARARADSVAREIVAFANSQGGLILLGVEDNGEVKGISDEKFFEEKVANIARHNVIPPIELDYQSLRISGKLIGIVKVARGRDKPYQTIDNKFLIRVGTTTRAASQPELNRLFQSAGPFHYDAVTVSGTSQRDLNLAKIDSYLKRYEIDFSSNSDEEKERLLTNSDILGEAGEATVAGLLIFGINPTQHLHQAGISFAHFQGNEPDGELIDKQLVDGTLDFQIDSALAIIKNNILSPSTINGLKREDKGKRYPDKIFRELLTNACIHRNYSIAGSKIRIWMFANRVEFISPGRLPNSVTVEKLEAGVSYSVNPILLKFMENLRYCDQLGRGLPMVCREAKKLEKTVEFKELGEEFKVTLQIGP